MGRGPAAWGLTLLALRLHRDMTRQELAIASGVPEDLVADLEEGQAWGEHMEALDALARALGVPRARLFRPPARRGESW